MPVLLHDRSPITSREVLDNGFLKIPATFARTGVQTYLAGELGLKDKPAGEVVRLYRPADEVFAPASMATWAHKPVTDDHPAVMVDASNSKLLSIGLSGDAVARKGDLLDGVIIVSDAGGIAKINGGKEEISLGYYCDIEWAPGTSPKGETFDAVQRNIRGNHIALVDAGRCGAECRLADTAPGTPASKAKVSDCGCNAQGAQSMADTALKTMLVDGIGSVEVNAVAEQVITRLLGDAKAAATSHAAAIAAKDGEIAALNTTHAAAITAKDAEITAAKAATPDAAALDARVAARAKLIGDAKRLGGDALVVDGKSDDEVRLAAVTAKLGDAAVKDRPAEFIVSAFDTLVLQLPAGDGKGGTAPAADPLRDHLTSPPAPGGGVTQPVGDAKLSYEERMKQRQKNRGGAATQGAR